MSAKMLKNIVSHVLIGTKYGSVRSMSVKSKKLMFTEFGDPLKVVVPLEEEISCVNNDDVLVKLLASPVNPADINLIEGKYPVKIQLPAVGGNEFVAEVVEVGSEVKGLSAGDRVITGATGLGVWRTFGVYSSKHLMKVPKELGILEAATLTVNPCTAYRMIKDYRTLLEGDTLIQNGANSACGQTVIQLCKVWGINSVNVVRNRPDIDKLKAYLTDLGATYVLTEEEIRKTDIFKTGKLPKPKLALNCVGGKSAVEIMRYLDHTGAIVTYGGMSREPVIVPVSALIFKDISVVGYWMSRWFSENRDSDAAKVMLNDLFTLILKGHLKGPLCKAISFDSYKEALKNATNVQGFVGKKYLLQGE